MIEIVQAGQASKTKLLFEMHRLRAHVFKERMGWNVSINEMGMEIDQFDIQDSVYFLAFDDEGSLVGSWRISDVNAADIAEAMGHSEAAKMLKMSRVGKFPNSTFDAFVKWGP